MAKRDCEAGYTVIELLVATTLLAMFGIALAAVVRFGLSSEAMLSNRHGGAQNWMAARDFLESRIGSATAVPFATSAGDVRRLPLQGIEDEMSFYAPAPDVDGGVGLAKYRIYVQRTANANNLMCEVQAQRASGASDSVRSSVLLTSAAAIKFSYFGATEASPSPSWRPDWRSIAFNPAIVNVKFESSMAAQIAMPNIAISLTITADMGCNRNGQWAQCAIIQ